MSVKELCFNLQRNVTALQRTQIENCDISILNFDKSELEKIDPNNKTTKDVQKIEQTEKKIEFCLQINYELWFQQNQYSIFCENKL
jgi:hypothetical protein